MQIFKSKKFWVTIGSLVSILLITFTNVAEETITIIVDLCITLLGMAFNIGQGIADNGKEKAKIDKDS